MKKIFTFLFCTTSLVSAFAQTNCTSHSPSNNTENIQSNNNDPRYERDKEIERINYMNNIQVQRLIDDSYLTLWEKRDALNALESQRIKKINIVYAKYSNSVAYYTSNEINNSFEKTYRGDNTDGL